MHKAVKVGLVLFAIGGVILVGLGLIVGACGVVVSGVGALVGRGRAS